MRGETLDRGGAKVSGGSKHQGREERAPRVQTSEYSALRVSAHLRASAVQRLRRHPWLILPILAGIAALLLLGRGVLGPRDATWTRIRETGVWRVGMDPSFPPFENLNDRGQVVGLDPELAAAIAERWGVRVEIVSLGFDELLDSVAARKVDAAISALPVVEERTQELHFSDAYVDAGIVLAVPVGSPIRSIEGLTGKRLAAEWGSAGDTEARALREKDAGAVELVLRDTMTAALDAVVAGEADVAAVDAISLALYAQRDRLEPPAIYLSREPYVVVLSARAPDLKAEINAALRALESDGTLTRIRDRWLRPAGGG